MFEHRLVERVIKGGEPATPRPDPSAVLADVLLHLRELFNIRQGAIPLRADYGMPDINGLVDRFPAAIEILRGAIADQIRRFEPRLDGISVRHLPNPEDPLTLAFLIQAQLRLGDRQEQVAFSTCINDDGKVTLTA